MKVTEILQKREGSVDYIYLGFAQAFDTVAHDGLLLKIRYQVNTSGEVKDKL